jgi:hypothetical protein
MTWEICKVSWPMWTPVSMISRTLTGRSLRQGTRLEDRQGFSEVHPQTFRNRAEALGVKPKALLNKED